MRREINVPTVGVSPRSADQSGSTPETPAPVTEVAIAVDRTLLMRRYARRHAYARA